jgi:hypothetical protein
MMKPPCERSSADGWELVHRRLKWRRQDCPNPRSQGLSVERFEQEWQTQIVADGFAHVYARHQNRLDARTFREEMGAQVGARQSRHFLVRDHHVYRPAILARQLQRLLPVGGGKHGVPVSLEQNRDEPAKYGIVIHYENDELA